MGEGGVHRMRHKTHNRRHPLTDNPASAAHHPDTPGKYISTLLHLILILLTATLTTQSKAQWDIEESHTTASLRGIHNVGGGVAWASGAHGTVRRTEDGGYLWQTCTIPPGAENLDFRGIQAFDENTAIVMSSGPGDQSRLYKTTDGCQTWHLLFTNPDKQGFWDALQLASNGAGFLLGDPVDSQFVLFHSGDAGVTWKRVTDAGLKSFTGDGAFAASNSSFVLVGQEPYFGVGGWAGGHLYRQDPVCPTSNSGSCPVTWSRHAVPVGIGPENAGVFSVAGRVVTDASGLSHWFLIAVGGNYMKPAESDLATAAFSLDGGNTWSASPNPTPRLPLGSSLRPHPKTLDHRRPQRHRHLPRRRPQLAASQTLWLRPRRRRQKLERPLTPLRRGPQRPHRQTPHHRPAQTMSHQPQSLPTTKPTRNRSITAAAAASQSYPFQSYPFRSSPSQSIPSQSQAKNQNRSPSSNQILYSTHTQSQSRSHQSASPQTPRHFPPHSPATQRSPQPEPRQTDSPAPSSAQSADHRETPTSGTSSARSTPQSSPPASATPPQQTARLPQQADPPTG